MPFLNYILPQFFKTAVDIEYQPHQKSVAEAMKDKRGLLVYHGLGSGKTLTSILVGEQEGGATVIVPASLRENFQKELKKAKAKQKYDIYSYEKFVKDKPDLTDKLLILDEAHRIRNSGSKRSVVIRDKGESAKKVLLLTGTPIQNKPNEISPLINLITSQNTFPMSESDFGNKYLKKKLEYSWNKPVRLIQQPNMLDDFKRKIDGHVSYYKPGKEEDYPTVIEKELHIPMSDRQIEVYKSVERSLPKSLRDKIQNFLPPEKNESSALNAFLSAVRQIANTSEKFDMHHQEEADNPKLHKMLGHIKKSPGQTVVYSNYLSSGIEPLSSLLDKHKVPHEKFTGEMSDRQKREVVERYNSGKAKVLLVSTAGGEGLDLKNTRQVHIMEPHWHEAKIDQVVGRAVRFKSHDDLSPEDRNVTVYKYFSTFPESKSIFGYKTKPKISVDQYLDQLSKDKEKVNETFLKALQEKSIT